MSCLGNFSFVVNPRPVSARRRTVGLPLPSDMQRIASDDCEKDTTATHGFAELELASNEMSGSCSIFSGTEYFNVLRVGAKFSKAPLAVVAFAALSDVSRELGLPFDRLKRFCHAVDDSMPVGNAYHNKLHVSDVTQMMHRLTHSEDGPLYEASRSDQKVRLSAILGALVHDLRHPGVTNSFLKATNHPLAREYGSESTSEKMHTEFFRNLIDTPSMDFLEPLGPKERSRVINLVRQIVLATDMAKHGEFLARTVPEEPDDLLVYKLQFAMKASDLSHCMRSFRVHSQIVNMLKNEFYEQGDREKSLGVAMSFGMNRDETDAQVAAGQADFLTGVIQPMLTRYLEFCGAPLISHLGDCLQRNIHSWRVIAQTGDTWSLPLYSDQKLNPRMRLQNSRSIDQRSTSISRLAEAYSITCDSDTIALLVDEVEQRVNVCA